VLLLALAAAVAVFGLLLLTGCTTTKYVPIIEHQTDTLIQRVVERDSIHVQDSTRVTEKGDTMLIEKWHTKFVEREVHDTLYQATHDTIPQPYTVTEYVERKRSKLDWFFIITGIIALIAVIVYAAVKVRKFLP
jgi:hypothetical protein